ncbi:hypothetical protein AB0M80_30680 [Amycolatopsis sp. NPDC051045]|uniref:hypothetical protein n=1 Tax=Amycolatopsis sp. NPDC051045 TaxID=3156922 RepID=UPI00343DBF8F
MHHLPGAGVTAAGRLADRWPGQVVALGGPLLLAGWIALAPTARILHLATGAPTMAGSFATAALNLGATAGPVLAGALLTAVSPFWIAAALVVAALALAVPLRTSLVTTVPTPAGPGAANTGRSPARRR